MTHLFALLVVCVMPLTCAPVMIITLVINVNIINALESERITLKSVPLTENVQDTTSVSARMVGMETTVL